jgi:hypothetical protein
MSSPSAVLRAYYDAWKASDFDRLRSLLADDMQFSGPLAEINGADECVAGGLRPAPDPRIGVIAPG